MTAGVPLSLLANWGEANIGIKWKDKTLRQADRT